MISFWRNKKDFTDQHLLLYNNLIACLIIKVGLYFDNEQRCLDQPVVEHL